MENGDLAERERSGFAHKQLSAESGKLYRQPTYVGRLDR
jgi:hypothetical protein